MMAEEETMSLTAKGMGWKKNLQLLFKDFHINHQGCDQELLL